MSDGGHGCCNVADCSESEPSILVLSSFTTKTSFCSLRKIFSISRKQPREFRHPSPPRVFILVPRISGLLISSLCGKLSRRLPPLSLDSTPLTSNLSLTLDCLLHRASSTLFKIDIVCIINCLSLYRHIRQILFKFFVDAILIEF